MSLSAEAERINFIERLRNLRKISVSAYHHELLEYLPEPGISQEDERQSAFHQGLWYTDTHLLCHRSDAAGLIYDLHAALPHCRILVSVGDEFDFGWSQIPDPVRHAVDFKIRLARHYPHCKFITVLGNHDADPAYIEAMQAAAASCPNIVFERYVSRIADTLFTHGD